MCTVLDSTSTAFNNGAVMKPNRLACRHRRSGFTLIEVMITVVIVTILAAVAVPSFLDSVRKGRRSEAFTALSAMQLAQERYRSNNATYASTLAAINTVTPTVPAGYYDLAITSPTATGYVVTAIAPSTSSQSSDGACAKLGVKVEGGAIEYAGTGSSGTLTYAATNPCWSK